MHVERRTSQELVDENCREELVCSKYSEGLAIVINKSPFVRVERRARPFVLSGELVNRNSREEPVCSKCRDGSSL